MLVKFLLSSTALLIFITSIFAQAPSGLVTAPQSRTYLLGPGDEVSGKVVGEQQFDFVATVNEDGNIMVPFSNKPVPAQCRSEKQLREDITVLLEKQLRNPQFSLITKRNSRPPAAVYGEVRKPMEFDLKRGRATLLELLAYTGGATEEAGGVVEITRTQPPLCAEDRDAAGWTVAVDGVNTAVPMRMFSLASLQVGKEDPVVYPGDIIRVHRAPPVYVVGEVVAPQGIYLREEGMTLKEAITKLGGVRREAKTKEIKIYRLKDANTKDRETLIANLDLINKGEQRDIALQPYDIVEVDKAKESIASTILQFAIGAGKTAVTSGVSSIGYRVVY